MKSRGYPTMARRGTRKEAPTASSPIARNMLMMRRAIKMAPAGAPLPERQIMTSSSPRPRRGCDSMASGDRLGLFALYQAWMSTS